MIFPTELCAAGICDTLINGFFTGEFYGGRISIIMNMKQKFSRLTAFLLLPALLLSGCSLPGGSNQAISRSGFYFDTVISVTIYDSTKESVLDGCFDLAAQYEGYFSNTVADSDISRINAAGGEPVTVHDETIELLQKGIFYGELSDGKFDITIGKLSDLWNFSTKALLDETDESMLPSAEEITEALSTVDYRCIQINGNEVSLTNPNARIDLGGIAKGYIADRMKDYLLENGVTDGFINLGGNVLTLKGKADGSAYTIGIQKPFDQDGTSIASVQVKDMTVVSSGVYERYFEVNGTRYHHILDTANGYPYNNGLLGVTILTKDSVDGDALSTTCFSLGLEKGMELVERLDGTEAIFITDDYALHVSSGIGKQIPFQQL